MIELAEREWGGKVDIVVNNAGVALLGRLAEFDEEAWDTTMAVNVRAAMSVTKAFLPSLLLKPTQNSEKDETDVIERGNGKGGVIVNVSSVAGHAALANHAAYCASKAALEMLTKCMTAEWAALGIRANTVAPTVVLTAMGKAIWEGTPQGDEMLKRLPMRRFARPEEVADVVAFLASCLLYTSPSPRDQRGSRMPSSA